ncbi:MAG: peptidylprolyl isomerase [Sedimentisphaeraceae bacterium JB056]
MQKAEKGNTVKVHYKGSLDDGSVFDSSEGRDPIEFQVGGGMMIPGFDAGVEGMEVGEKKTIKIPSAEAYGPYREEMIAVLDRDEVPVDFKLVVGMVLQMRSEQGGAMTVTVKELTDDKITLDGNHALAGKDLTFEIELVEVK